MLALLISYETVHFNTAVVTVKSTVKKCRQNLLVENTAQLRTTERRNLSVTIIIIIIIISTSYTRDTINNYKQ